MTAPLLVVAVGNPSRGDDAIGPRLLQRLREAGVEADARVELLEDFQLQVEHALDLVGRAAVLFVDASHAPVPDGAALWPVAAAHGHPPASHALLPAAVLAVFERVQGRPAPPAWQLAVQGDDFALGAGLGAAAQHRLARGCALAQEWIAQHCAPRPAARG